jgi:hypothetical protein
MRVRQFALYNHSEVKVFYSRHPWMQFASRCQEFPVFTNFAQIDSTENMNTFLEILKYILPSLVVLATTWYLVKSFLDYDRQAKAGQLKADVQKSSLPIRMQAYERLVLLLERLQPAGLMLRTNIPGMNAQNLQTALIQAVRDEYEHNLSQQLYVSVQAWEMVKNAREETIKLINTAGSKVQPGVTSAELAQQLFIIDLEAGVSSSQVAIDFLKQEAREYFF